MVIGINEISNTFDCNNLLTLEHITNNKFVTLDEAIVDHLSKNSNNSYVNL